MYAVHLLELAEHKILSLEDHKVLQGYVDVFSEEVLVLPSKREIEFTIDLV